MACTLTLTCISCNKDEIKPQVFPHHDAKYDTYYKLKSFIEKANGEQQVEPFLFPRSGYSPSEIIEYVEGALNLEYADAGLTWESYDHTRDTFVIALTDGYASQGDVNALFAEAVDSASSFFYGLTEEDKFPNLFDVEGIGSPGSIYMIKVTTVIGKVHRNPAPFGDNDFWSIIQHKGRCTPIDDPSDFDAGIIMSQALEDYYNMYGCVFFTNEFHATSLTPEHSPHLTDSGWGQINHNDETPGDFIEDYRTFKSTCEHNSQECVDFFDENGVYCVPPEGMNYYFQSIIEIFAGFTIALEGLVPETTINIDDYPRIEFGMDVHTWECDQYFGTVNYCDTGNDFPYSLPN